MTVIYDIPGFSPKKFQLGIFELETLEWVLKQQQHPNGNTILEW